MRARAYVERSINNRTLLVILGFSLDTVLAYSVYIFDIGITHVIYLRHVNTNFNDRLLSRYLNTTSLFVVIIPIKMVSAIITIIVCWLTRLCRDLSTTNKAQNTVTLLYGPSTFTRLRQTCASQSGALAYYATQLRVVNWMGVVSTATFAATKKTRFMGLYA